MSQQKADILAGLQADILRLQGFKTVQNTVLEAGLGPLKHAFPNATFPLGAMHEFIAVRPEETAAAIGFMGGLLNLLMSSNRAVLWISSTRMLFPPALKGFDLSPDRFIFVDVQKEKDALWALDEALKCSALVAVVGELPNMSFTHSRRLQLAVEESQVTGFLLRNQPRTIGTTACVSRWQITPLPSATVDDLPGIGFPKWRVHLQRIRNGKPGTWDIQWTDGRFVPVYQPVFTIQQTQQQAG
ncbi:ImuA family protein [Ohtaekwangia koreensis]|uniref:Protein ImuA n=1 Tax=Ohtaekwangia koreensis TaxID=688867 RepID=A0A1T5KK89_9BACT|nr:Error-prone repair protein ImuA [Ohtaekwangia koreensis]SKC64156.1 protein ImuA [Ohtaekwangia koreensis]